uniref:Glycine-rich protein n=1 Tax=Oryza glumipatula TaxID=40148 RepID=A0A0E0A4M8_9ORYZ
MFGKSRRVEARREASFVFVFLPPRHVTLPTPRIKAAPHHHQTRTNPPPPRPRRLIPTRLPPPARAQFPPTHPACAPASRRFRGRNGRDDFFGGRDPFAGFGGFGRQRSLISGVFGGRDPFDDPFFNQPFGSGMHGPSLFGPMGGPFGDIRNDGFLEQAPPRGNGRKPIITELDEEEGENSGRQRQANREPYVQEPDDEMQGGQLQPRRDFNRANEGQPQARTFTYQSSSVTYGGVNGAYYTASKTRRTGSDGITVEESKEADTTTKEATHRISRGIHDKGHSLTRKLKSDGNVDTTQILHNLHEDELAGFEESWKGNARHHLAGLNQNAGTSNNNEPGNRGTSGRGRQSAWGWALPGREQGRDQRRNGERPKSRVIPIS